MRGAASAPPEIPTNNEVSNVPVSRTCLNEVGASTGRMRPNVCHQQWSGEAGCASSCYLTAGEVAIAWRAEHALWMKLLRGAISAIFLAGTFAACLRVRGTGGTPPQHGGWRPLELPDR